MSDERTNLTADKLLAIIEAATVTYWYGTSDLVPIDQALVMPAIPDICPEYIILHPDAVDDFAQRAGPFTRMRHLKERRTR